jgi:hypothetical protein
LNAYFFGFVALLALLIVYWPLVRHFFPSPSASLQKSASHLDANKKSLQRQTIGFEGHECGLPTEP